jgi:hypothetical protein
MIHTLAGWLHGAVDRRVREIRALLAGDRGQGTVEYVGLIPARQLSDGRHGGGDERVQ